MEHLQDLYYGYTDSKNNYFNKAKVRHIDGFTEELFASPIAYQEGNLFEKVAENCLIQLEDNFGNPCQDSKSKIINSLATGDFHLLLVGISTATHETKDRQVATQCPKCNAFNDINYNTNDLQYHKPDGPVPKRYDIKIGKRVFTLEWIPYSKEMDVIKTLRKNLGKDEVLNDFKVRNELLKLSLKSITNDGKPETLDAIPGRVLTSLFRKNSEQFSYGVNFVHKVKCSKCSHSWDQDLLEIATKDNLPGGLFHFFGISTPENA